MLSNEGLSNRVRCSRYTRHVQLCKGTQGMQTLHMYLAKNFHHTRSSLSCETVVIQCNVLRRNAEVQRCLPMHCAGSIPLTWLSTGSTLSTVIDALILNDNCLAGSIPATVGGNFVLSSGMTTAAKVVVDPMKKSFGLCGQIPGNMNIQSTERGRLQGTMPAGSCPGVHHTFALRQIRKDLSSCVHMSVTDAFRLL